MSDIRRIDPRRPFRVTPAGLKRIVLGATGPGDAQASIGDIGRKTQAKPLRLNRTPDRWVMAIAHSVRGSLDGHARQAIAAAAILAGSGTGVVAVVLGGLNDDLTSVGADRVAVLPEFDATRFQPERELAALARLINDYKPARVFLPDNALGDGDLGRRLMAAHSNDAAAAHVVEVTAQQVSVPWSGGVLLARTALPRFVLVEDGVVNNADLPFVGAGEVVAQTDVIAAPDVCRDLGLEEMDATQVPLEEADFIVGAGNGVRNVATLEALARALGAAVGASRVAVDDGKFSRDKQIGATGKTVRASTYVAVGISGAVQHLQGIKDCRHVIAINRDAGAPIVQRADLTVIGDAEDLMQALLTRIEQAKAQRELSVSP
jgi:electron transfer flavoprotein alpha subunit